MAKSRPGHLFSPVPQGIMGCFTLLPSLKKSFLSVLFSLRKRSKTNSWNIRRKSGLLFARRLFRPFWWLCFFMEMKHLLALFTEPVSIPMIDDTLRNNTLRSCDVFIRHVWCLLASCCAVNQLNINQCARLGSSSLVHSAKKNGVSLLVRHTPFKCRTLPLFPCLHLWLYVNGQS